MSSVPRSNYTSSASHAARTALSINKVGLVIAKSLFPATLTLCGASYMVVNFMSSKA